MRSLGFKLLRSNPSLGLWVSVGFRNAFGAEEAELPSSTTDAVTGGKVDVSAKEVVTDDVESESEDDG